MIKGKDLVIAMILINVLMIFVYIVILHKTINIVDLYGFIYLTLGVGTTVNGFIFCCGNIPDDECISYIDSLVM